MGLLGESWVMIYMGTAASPGLQPIRARCWPHLQPYLTTPIVLFAAIAVRCDGCFGLGAWGINGWIMTKPAPYGWGGFGHTVFFINCLLVCLLSAQPSDCSSLSLCIKSTTALYICSCFSSGETLNPACFLSLFNIFPIFLKRSGYLTIK
jgi:hypothetical protein